jgi:hypothetical protein
MSNSKGSFFGLRPSAAFFGIDPANPAQPAYMDTPDKVPWPVKDGKAATVRTRLGDKNQSERQSQKFQGPANPVALEHQIKEIVPTPNVMAEARKMVYDAREQMILMKNSNPLQKEAELTALNFQRMKDLDKTVTAEVNGGFQDDFLSWVLKRGNPEDHARSGWWPRDPRTKRPITEPPNFIKEPGAISSHPTVRSYIKQFVDAPIEYQKTLANMHLEASMDGPCDWDINKLYLYYKYYVRGFATDDEVQAQLFALFCDVPAVMVQPPRGDDDDDLLAPSRVVGRGPSRSPSPPPRRAADPVAIDPNVLGQPNEVPPQHFADYANEHALEQERERVAALEASLREEQEQYRRREDYMRRQDEERARRAEEQQQGFRETEERMSQQLQALQQQYEHAERSLRELRQEHRDTMFTGVREREEAQRREGGLAEQVQQIHSEAQQSHASAEQRAQQMQEQINSYRTQIADMEKAHTELVQVQQRLHEASGQHANEAQQQRQQAEQLAARLHEANLSGAQLVARVQEMEGLLGQAYESAQAAQQQWVQLLTTHEQEKGQLVEAARAAIGEQTAQLQGQLVTYHNALQEREGQLNQLSQQHHALVVQQSSTTTEKGPQEGSEGQVGEGQVGEFDPVAAATEARRPQPVREPPMQFKDVVMAGEADIGTDEEQAAQHTAELEDAIVAGVRDGSLNGDDLKQQITRQADRTGNSITEEAVGIILAALPEDDVEKAANNLSGLTDKQQRSELGQSIKDSLVQAAAARGIQELVENVSISSLANILEEEYVTEGGDQPSSGGYLGTAMRKNNITPGSPVYGKIEGFMTGLPDEARAEVVRNENVMRSLVAYAQSPSLSTKKRLTNVSKTISNADTKASLLSAIGSTRWNK